MRRSNLTVLQSASPEHGETNPNWERHMTPVYAGRGAQSERVEMVVIRSIGGDIVEGWDREGRYVQVRNVRYVDTRLRRR